jgi:hypothetical protein
MVLLKHLSAQILSTWVLQLTLLLSMLGFSGNSASSSPLQKQITKTEVLTSVRKYSGRTIAYARLFSPASHVTFPSFSFRLASLHYDQSLNTLFACCLRELLGFLHTERFIFFLPSPGDESQPHPFIG